MCPRQEAVLVAPVLEHRLEKGDELIHENVVLALDGVPWWKLGGSCGTEVALQGADGLGEGVNAVPQGVEGDCGSGELIW